MSVCLTLLLISSIVEIKNLSETPLYEKLFHFVDTFEDDAFEKRWHHSMIKTLVSNDSSELMYNGKFKIGHETNDSVNNALIIENPESFNNFGIFRLFEEPFYFDDTFILQYELSFKNDHKCGGAYLKLISKDSGLSTTNLNLDSNTAYTIMFGPDICENTSKFHFIFRHKNQNTGKIEEKHMKQPNPSSYKHIFNDGKIHQLKLTTYKWAQRFVVELDNYIISQGSLLKDFEPPVNPEEYILDPYDYKPVDWDDREFIIDPSDTKPDDWDESQPKFIDDVNAIKPDDWFEDETPMIDDLDAVQPDEWDDSIDGDWIAPKIVNPKCSTNKCGPWIPPVIENPKYRGPFTPKMISNPNYKGKFNPRKIKNPDYFKDENPFKMIPIDGVAIEVVASPNIITFDNIIITNNADALVTFNSNHWKLKNPFNLKIFMSNNKNSIIIGVVIILALLLVSILIKFIFKKSPEVVEETPSIDKSDTPENLVEEPDNAEIGNPDTNESEDDIDHESTTRRRSSRRKKNNDS